MDIIIWRWLDMTINIEGNVVHIVILDISGIYVQIYDQGYFDHKSVGDIKQQYSDKKHWQVLVLN